jgi:CRP/FNR family cyclic AMP-dependent transcriptional regulator
MLNWRCFYLLKGGFFMPTSPRKLLQYNELFELFPPQVRQALYATAYPKTYQAGEYVFRNGDEGPYFMAAVMSGRLRMGEHSLEGKEMLIAMVEKGEIFGEMSVFDNMPRAVDVVAETDCTCLIIKRDDFLPLVSSFPEVLLGIMKIMCHRMRLYAHTLELIALQNLPARLARYLLRLAKEYGVEENGKIRIQAGLSQADIGQQLATTRESINKQLKVFVSKGYITVDGDTIALTDVRGLKELLKSEITH